jgi:aspartyl-tRNA(Asn)/glutamyl-tRNA(Gln) amidotransferase subunit C
LKRGYVPIDRETIRRLERLSGLALAANERDTVAVELERVVEHFRDIQSVDIRRIPEGSGPEPRLRDDVVHPGLGREEVLDRAPDRDGHFFRVPPLFERGEE